MILQALTRLYEDLHKRGDIAAPGWSKTKISFALCLDGEGRLTQVIPTMREVAKGKKTFPAPQEIELTAPVKKTSGISSNFLWENSGYLLGVDQKGKPERSKECFTAAAKLHHTILDGVDSPVAKAILTFFDTWQPENAAEHPALAGQLDEVTAGGINLLFRVRGCNAQEDAAIREAWQRYREGVAENAVKMQCLVTGREDSIMPTHPSIKGVRDAQTSGAALVSFNKPAFCSYGREQNYNAPVGAYAAFAYTAALNHLLADRKNVQFIGDTTVVCWAEGADPIYPDLFMSFVSGNMPATLSENDVRAVLRRLAQGLPCKGLEIDTSRAFYILGLAPNAARISVRFFLRDSFGAVLKNVNEHYERMEISGAKESIIPIWKLLKSTVRDPKKQTPAPNMAGATVRSIISGLPYPRSLMESTVLRIRSEQTVTWERASILKAYMIKNYPSRLNKEIAEVAQVQLNEDCNYMPYVFGRLFRVMEEVQVASTDWKIERTIRDSFFNMAASTPRSAFGKIIQLNNYHMKKLMRDKPGLAKKYNDLEVALVSKLTSPPPARFSQEETNCFYIGYYHQTQKRFTKKEGNENG